ncbi:hypothetical protein RD110_05765 [Rhodoferax koreense]|uniref:Uncharacterized protein n=1 Tax=Rhodoferax koreensis TaxID=1842727 RepID=A0A1P8JSN1_9BURK|nr:hypothetical protein [Rhodoferax koreense]APW36759.1 hypothetical protein RD110_05765 [Rhodoferax koreense]
MRTTSHAKSDTPDVSALTAELITAYGVTVKNLVQAYRIGGERMADFLEQRWSAALGQSHDRLSAEARRNAKLAHDLAGSVYHRSLDLSTAGAEAVVDKVIELAQQGVHHAAANAARFDEKIGVGALDKLARVVAPAAAAANVLANHIEATSGEWVQKIADETAARPAVRRRTAFARARARRAA